MAASRRWHPDKPSSVIEDLLAMEEIHVKAAVQEFGPSVTSLEHSQAALLSVIWQVNRIEKTGWPLWKQVAFVGYSKAQRLSFAAFRLACRGYATESAILQRTHYEIIAVNAYGACRPARADAGKAIRPGDVRPKNFIEGELKCDFSRVRDHLGTQAHGLKADVAEDLVRSWAGEGGGVHAGFGWKPERVATAFAVLNLFRWLDAALLLDYFPELDRYVRGPEYAAMVDDLREHFGERPGWPKETMAEADRLISIVRAALRGDDWKSLRRPG